MHLIALFIQKRSGFKAAAVLFSALLIVFSISACGDKSAEEKTASVSSEAPAVEGEGLPEGHPTMTDEKLFTEMPRQDHTKLKSSKPVKVTDAIRARYKSVNIRVNDNSKGTKDTLKMGIGETKDLADGFSLKVDVFLPDYSIFDDYIASSSDELNNPAVKVVLSKGGKTVASGWVFEAMAQYNSYSHLRYAVALLPAE